MANNKSIHSKQDGQPSKEKELKKAIMNMGLHIQELREVLSLTTHIIDKLEGRRIVAKNIKL